MKKLLSTFFVLFLILNCTVSSTKKGKNDIVNERIVFLLKLKNQVANNTWEEFGKKKEEGPLFYFQDNETYIFFVDSIVESNLSLKFSKKGYSILNRRYDSIPFHMETQIEFDTINSSPLLLNHPIEFCSSPEETKIIIPSVNTTELWLTMVIHEMFHHFQFNNERFRDYMKSISELGYDNRDLKKLIDLDSLFKKRINIENEILLKVLKSNNNDSINTLLNNFIAYRTERRNRYCKIQTYFTKVEDAFEKMEGSARYIEYQSMLTMSDLSKSKDSLILKKDSLFNNFNDFKNFNLINEDFEYLQTVSYDYYYTLGFNLLRVFDKLNINYKNVLFKSPEISLTDLLVEYQKKPTK